MRSEKRSARMREIEAHAYLLFDAKGFEGTSMLAVAKRAKASNETMYRWYGDKNGLFQSMVETNAAQVRDQLELLSKENRGAMKTLEHIAPVLLEMLLSDRAIALNRAAASDPSGGLGRILGKAGREEVFPLIQEILQRAVKAGEISPPMDGELGPLFMNLLVGDQQIRRVIGTLRTPSKSEVAEKAAQAIKQLRVLCRS